MTYWYYITLHGSVYLSLSLSLSIYIYIYREREREILVPLLIISSLCIYIYIYIYIHTCYAYIYIYIYAYTIYIYIYTYTYISHHIISYYVRPQAEKSRFEARGQQKGGEGVVGVKVCMGTLLQLLNGNSTTTYATCGDFIAIYRAAKRASE